MGTALLRETSDQIARRCQSTHGQQNSFAVLGLILLSYSLGILTIIAHTHTHTRTLLSKQQANESFWASLMKKPRPWGLERSLQARKEAQTEFTGEQEEVRGKDSGCGKKSRAILLVPLRVVTKISSCRVNRTSGWGIKQLGISFGSIFLLFPFESSRGRRS